MSGVENKTNEFKRKRQAKTHFVEYGDTSWSYEEKKNLLIALKKYGHLDMDNLCKAVPTKNSDRIKTFVNMMWKYARLTLMKSAVRKCKDTNTTKTGRRRRRKKNPSPATAECHLGPIDKWLTRMKQAQPANYIEERAVPIAKAMLYISKFECHPDPSECGGIDFKAMYEFLYSVLSGFPPKTLTSATSHFILHTMSNFAASFKKRDFSEEVDYLENVSSVSFPSPGQAIPTSCLGTDVSAELTPGLSLLELLKVPGFNPLGVPFEMLVVPKL